MTQFLIAALVTTAQPVTIEQLLSSEVYQYHILDRLAQRKRVELNQQHVDKLFNKVFDDLM